MKTLHAVAPAAEVPPGSCGGREPGLEVWGVIDIGQNPDGTTECEQLDPDDDRDAEFWSIYEHQPDGECYVVDDYNTREAALYYAQELSSQKGLPVYDFTREGYR